jgi:hypothetical protein
MDMKYGPWLSSSSSISLSRDRSIVFQTEEDKIMFSRWEIKLLRKMCGAIIDQSVWRIGTNQELRKFYKTPDLLLDIEKISFELLGRVIRTAQTNVTKKISVSKPKGKTKVGWPRFRVIEDVENDSRELKAKK